MDLSCVICSDLFRGTDDAETVFATSCGHLFHYACLLEWFKRSKSCPQCRHKQSKRNITRIYLLSNTASDDTSTLKNTEDSLSYQLKLKDVKIKNLKEAKRTLKKLNKGLREEVKNIKDESQSNVTQLLAYKETISHLKKECEKLTKAKLEAEDLRNKIDNERILKMRKKLKADMKKIDEYLSIFSPAHMKLKEDLRWYKRYVKSLKQKIQELESAIISPGANNPRDKALHGMLQESPAPESMGSSQLNSSMFGTSPPDRTPDNISKPVTPSLPFNNKKPDPENIQLSSSDNSEQFYNGMGGHSKHDLFPTPRLDKFKKLTKKKKLSASAVPFSKKHKSDTKFLH